MKIIFYYPGFVNTNKCLAGTNTMILTAAKHIAKRHSVTITSEIVNRIETVDNVCIVPIPMSGKTFRYDFSQFDIVFFFCGDMHLRCKKSMYQKWVRWQHCWNYPMNEYSDDLDVIIGVSDTHARNIIECGVPENKAGFVPNCIDTDIFKPMNVKRESNQIMFCGAIAESKGLHILVDAVRKLNARNIRVTVNVYGNSEMTNSPTAYEESVKAMACDLNVRFNGAVSKRKLAVAYSKSSILVLPSDIESFGLVLAEAQACGCIPVVHGAGGVGGVLIEGYMYFDNNSVGLSNAIIGALKNSDRLRDKVISESKIKFNPANTYKAIDNILRRILT